MRRSSRTDGRRWSHSAARLSVKWASGATLALLLTHSAAMTAGTRPAAPAEAPLSIQEEPLTQYRALRRMHARSEKFGHEGWLDAWTELDAKGFRFEVVSERGSDYVRNKVLREMLERERDMIAKGQTSRGDLSATNYEFSEPADQQPGERHVLLKPRRKDVMLVDGRMVLSPDGQELLRVEGRLAKNPSFWTSLVSIVRRYARLDGVRVPMSIETTAKVKIAGASRMTVKYEYESVNGRPVSVAARRSAAMAAAR
jgi:hypothetical protein